MAHPRLMRVLVLPSCGIGNRLVEHVTAASMDDAASLAGRVTTYSADYGEHSDFLAGWRAFRLRASHHSNWRAMPLTPDPESQILNRFRIPLSSDEAIGRGDGCRRAEGEREFDAKLCASSLAGADGHLAAQLQGELANDVKPQSDAGQ